MARLLLVLILIVAGFLGLGFYQKWFRVASSSADDKSNVTFTVNKDKIEGDKKKVREKIHDLGQQVKDATAAPTEKSKDDPAVPPVEPPQNQE